MLKRTYKL